MAATLPKMQYTNLGNTGCRVSRICLGCMSFGDTRWAPFVADVKESLPLIKKAYDAGINFFDTGKNLIKFHCCDTAGNANVWLRSKRILSRY
jgi:predicted aldo/keto reductase-like oxidoreductase